MLKNKRTKIARMKKGTLKQTLIEYFKANPRLTLNYKQVSAALGIVRQDTKIMVSDLLAELYGQHFLTMEREGRYRLSEAYLPRFRRQPMGDDIMSEFNLPEDYPEEAEKAAKTLKSDIPASEYSFREDFRGVCTFTIDPAEAKDFDDALSIRALEPGKWEVGVHIADVSFFVKPGNPIDIEAEKRATSVYLVDRVVPMLPERLCNDLCSLRPGEDRRCFSCILVLDEQARVTDYRIKRTVIHSDRRFTYEEAQAILDGADDSLRAELLQLNQLAKILRQRRIDQGAIQFESRELRFKTDENGKPLEVYLKESGESHNLIEEFMLLANRTVAESIGKGGRRLSFVYRVHDLPDMDKLADVARFAKKFGHHLSCSGTRREVNDSINRMLLESKGQPQENLLSAITVRAMAKAVYSTENIGHYGLAFGHYTHFTSPIRRYPDLMVHRLLEKYLCGGNSVNRESLERECEHCSAMEQLAAQAERASIKSKQVEYMADKLGKVFQGTISSVTEFGFFVEIDENHCEGLVGMRDLDDDRYELDEKNYCLRGRYRHKVYRLGDTVHVLVAKANLERRQLDLVLTDGEDDIKREKAPTPVEASPRHI